MPKNNWQKNILQEYMDLEEKNIYYKDFIERYPFNYFLTQNGDLFYLYLLRDDDYQLIYDMEDYRLFAKKK